MLTESLKLALRAFSGLGAAPPTCAFLAATCQKSHWSKVPDHASPELRTSRRESVTVRRRDPGALHEPLLKYTRNYQNALTIH